MNDVENWVEQYRLDPEFQFELVSIAIGEEIVAGLQALGLTRSDLAARMGVTRPRVTQLLAGDENLTVRTLVGIANALESQLEVRFKANTAERSIATSEVTNWIPRAGTRLQQGQTNHQLALAA